MKAIQCVGGEVEINGPAKRQFCHRRARVRAELEAIGDWIGEANPTRALSFVTELRCRCEALSDMPTGFPLVPRYKHLGIRRRPYGDYLIFYRVLNDTTEILHVLHGARDYEPIPFPNE